MVNTGTYNGREQEVYVSRLQRRNDRETVLWRERVRYETFKKIEEKAHAEMILAP